MYAEYVQDVVSGFLLMCLGLSHMLLQVKQRCSQLRGELKTLAQHLVATEYHLAGLSKVELADRIEKLLERGRFAFRDTDEVRVESWYLIFFSHCPPIQRQGMFGHRIFTVLMAKQWLTKHGEGCGRYSIQFNPAPLALIAFMVTAVSRPSYYSFCANVS